MTIHYSVAAQNAILRAGVSPGARPAVEAAIDLNAITDETWPAPEGYHWEQVPEISPGLYRLVQDRP